MENFSEVSDTVTCKYARIHEKSETSVRSYRQTELLRCTVSYLSRIGLEHVLHVIHFYIDVKLSKLFNSC